MGNTLADTIKELMWAVLAITALLILINLWKMTGEVNSAVREDAKNGEVTRVNRTIDFQDAAYGFTPDQATTQIMDFYDQYPYATADIDGTVVRSTASLTTIKRMFNSNYNYSREYVFDSLGNPVKVSYKRIRN
ncbi:MAG: hypothetical protein J6Y90_07455 [Lachnospiraceae bacterium]|nr:hypothetical protein [Lachnospiraceae bacterium]